MGFNLVHCCYLKNLNGAGTWKTAQFIGSQVGTDLSQLNAPQQPNGFDKLAKDTTQHNCIVLAYGAKEISMDERLKKALKTDRTIDITTIGRKSGQARRMEIWFHNLDGSIYITGTPGKRCWYANMLSNPRFTFHLKGSIVADLPALAIPILEEDQRRRILAEVTRMLKRREKTGEWVASNSEEFEQWVDGSPLVEVKFTQAT